jgi:peptidyl-prolyl cis-trans isomerase D
MLKQMRKGAHGVLAKLLIIALIASFAVWGIGDMVTGGTSNAVATVGKISITAQRYDRALERVRRSFGTHYTKELFNQLGVPDQVLNALINNALLAQEAKKLGLNLSDEMLVERIRNNPDFSNNSGEFDRQLFSLVLRDNRLNEQDYLTILREELNISLLEGLLGSVSITSAPVIDTIYHAQHETRDAEVFVIDASDIKAIGKPEENELEAMFAERKQMYQTPEYRTLSYITLDIQKLANELDVTDAEVEAAYNDNQDSYTVPSTRSIAQWLFANKEDAEKALTEKSEEMTKSPATAQVENGTYSDLGDVNEANLLEQAQNAVFSAKVGNLTEPVKTGFGWHVFVVRSDNPSSVKPFAEVSDSIRDSLLTEKKNKFLSSTVITIEDAIAGGESLETIASEYGTKINTLGPVTNDGTKQEGNEKVSLDDKDNYVLKNYFNNEEGQLSALGLGPENIYYLARTDEIIEAAPRPFEEVKPILLDEWKSTKQRAAKLERANEVSDAIKSESKSLAAIAREGIQRSKARNIKRQAQSLVLTNSRKLETTNGFIIALFNSQLNTPTAPFPLPNGNYAVGVVTDIEKAKPLSGKNVEAAKAVTRELNDQYRLELIDHYLRALRKEYSVSVNDALYQEVANR